MRSAIIAAAGLTGLVLSVSANGIAGWRGDGTGRFPGVSAPLHWDKAERVVWRTATPKWSNGSPVIAGDRLFLCAEPDTVLCLDKGTGDILWQRANGYADIAPEREREAVRKHIERAAAIGREIGKVKKKLTPLTKKAKESPGDADVKAAIDALKAEERQWQEELKAVQDYVLPSTHGANGYSSATPVTDGARVYVFFGTGVAAAYDLEGNRLWARVVEKPGEAWGHSASPALADGRLVIHIGDVHGLDPASGATVWTVTSRPRWGASVVATIAGQAVAITANGEIIRAQDGHLLASGLHRLEYCAPLVHDGVVYFIEHGGKAFRLPAKADGSEKPELLWKTEPPKERYYASPLFHEGKVYCINQKGVYSVIDAQTGRVLKSEGVKALKRTAYPSVTLAGSLVLLGAECGNAVFMEPGVEMKEVAATAVGPFRSCPIFEKDRAYIRTQDAMLCIAP